MIKESVVSIVSFKDEYAPWFETLNRAWIERFFWMEPMDFQILQNPREEILAKGGKIFFALYNDSVVGTVALRYVDERKFELTKMAVDEKFHGRKIGKQLAERAIDAAREMNASEVFLYSNTKLESAIMLYHKLGFIEVPVDGPYKRSDIKMQLLL